jgi:hypothetical protein
MTVRYWPPLEDALQRTRRLLFQPFDLGRWFVLGFTAWLIHLGEFGSSLAGSDPEVQTRVKVGDIGGATDAVREAITELLPSGLAAALVLALITAALVLALALLWVGCRARFVWLENLTAGDHGLGRHWTRFGKLGDAFFLWKLALYAAGLLAITPLMLFGGVLGALGLAGFEGPGSVLGWLLLGMAAFVLGVIFVYVDFFAESYVTVIMHRRGVGVLAAWREFRGLFEAHPGHFILVGLAKLALNLTATVLLAVAGLLTCCVGLMIMALPYLGAVIKLPAYAALRYFDLCWLGQFDEGLRLPESAPLRPGSPTPDSGPTP